MLHNMRCYACLPLKKRVIVKTIRGRTATEIVNWLQSLLLRTTADRRTIWNLQLSVMSMCAAGICCQVVSSCILYYRSISFSLLARHSNSLLSSWRSSPITTSSHSIIAAVGYEPNSKTKSLTFISATSSHSHVCCHFQPFVSDFSYPSSHLLPFPISCIWCMQP